MNNNFSMPKKKLKFTQAFTLIELLAVMVIMMIIAGLVVGVGGPARESARKHKAKVMIAALEVAISMYHSDTGEYPAQDEQNFTLVSNLKTNPGGSLATTWHGPYMEFKEKDLNNSDEVVDPWKNPYQYMIMEGRDPATDPIWGNINSYNLWSYGPDKTDDSYDEGNPDTKYDDDIYNW